MKIISNCPAHDITQHQLINIDDVSCIDSSSILYLIDTFKPQYLHDVYQNLGYPAATINDHYVTVDRAQFGDNIYSAPIWAASQGAKFNHDDLNFDLTVTHAACINCNKKKINRFLALKLAQWFKIDFEYTWSGSGRDFDLSEILSELDGTDWMSSDAKKFLLAPLELKKQWITTGNEIGWQHDEGRIRYRGNEYSWRGGMRDVFVGTAVAVITESLTFHQAAVLTEKSMFTILGANFPLWVGGYGQADAWKQVGFDAFDDVIDHSYQYLPTLIERCWAAFELNVDILTNQQLAQQLRINCQDRFLNNQDLLMSGQFFHYCQKEINSWPEPAKSTAVSLFDYVFNLKSSFGIA